MIAAITNYFKEARVELQKVIWPTRQETTGHTVAVVIISLAVALFLGGLDLAFTAIVRQFAGF